MAERGSVLGLRLIAWLSTAVGRTPARFVVRIVALYYFVFDAATRRASHDYLMRVHGNATLAMRYRHVLRFAEVTLDRAFIVAGKERYFDVTCNGNEHISQLTKSRRGAVLLGAHVGSFEAMRMQGKKESLRIHVLGHFSNARMINAALERLNPSANTNVISIDDSNPDFVLRIRERGREQRPGRHPGRSRRAPRALRQGEVSRGGSELPDGGVPGGLDLALPHLPDVRSVPGAQSVRAVLRALRGRGARPARPS
jgi:predicted LPLAT superfamily acyltransferase